MLVAVFAVDAFRTRGIVAAHGLRVGARVFRILVAAAFTLRNPVFHIFSFISLQTVDCLSLLMKANACSASGGGIAEGAPAR